MTDPAISASLMTVDPRGLAGTTALVMAGLLVLLYVYRRRSYILYWCSGWMLAAVSFFMAARPYGNDTIANLAYGISQFLGILSGLFFVVSADAYIARPRWRREYGLMLLPVALWFVLAPIPLQFRAVFAPGHLLAGGAMIAAGAAHLMLLRRRRLLGAAVVALALIAVGVGHFLIVYEAPHPVAPEASLVFITFTAAFLVGAVGMQLMTFEDMTYELRAANRQLESAQANLRELAITDALTHCRNRRFFDEIIGRELKRHRRYGIPLSLIFIDVDRFKVINDELGHETGDQVLQHVASFLVTRVREADFVFRWGGDEFMILLSCREPEANARAAMLQQAFADSDYVTTLPPGVGLSIGCVEVPIETVDVMEYVRIADERMYADKRKTGARR
jgi:diguanylate cyclase (GGDEF)-like protein